MEVYRTPDECFEGLPDFDFEPHYRQVGDLRLAHMDVGEGPPVVMLHGEPSWSFIYRKLFGPISKAGFRCIAPDHAGFGRSDKPVDPAWYGPEPYVAHISSLLEELDLRDVTLVVHDWGGPVGAAVALKDRDRIARMVVFDTVLDATEVWASETWVRFHDYVVATDDLPIGQIMRATCAQKPPSEVIDAYNAPFPVPEAQGGAHGLALATARVTETTPETKRLYSALRDDPLPVLMFWGEQDVVLPLAVGQRLAHAIGRRIDHVIPGAGHAIQEDQGDLVGSLIADWLASESG